MASEVELKFELAPEVISEFEASKWWSELHDSDKVDTLRSVYFDTRRYRLRARGMSLRVTQTTDKRIQTLAGAGASASVRTEWNAELDDDRPDLCRVHGSALGAIRAKRLTRKLVPVFETRLVRRTIAMHWRGSQIEIAIDHGSVIAEGCSAEIHEVGFTSKAAARQGIVALAKRMLEELPTRYCLLSEAERGYALATRKMSVPVRAAPIELDRATTVADAFRVIAHACLRHFALNEHGVIQGNAESVHQMRVGLRRLRAVFSIFKDLLDDPESKHIKAELRWLTDQLGRARDYDVFAHESRALNREAELHAAPVRELKSLLDERVAAGLVQATAAAASDRFRQIVAETALWIFGRHWGANADERLRLHCEMPLRTFAKRMLDRRTRKLRKKLQRVDELDGLQRHKLRIGVKKLHYATEFVASLFARRNGERKRFTRVLKRIQDTLGELNDSVVHERITSALVDRMGAASDSCTRPQLAFAAGLVRGQEDAKLHRLLASVRHDSARLARVKPFWR
jgi:inorganic triphosphatase YgiF